MKSLLDRILTKITIDEVGGCWNWIGAKRNDGYGTIRIGGKLRGVHRIAYEYFNRPIPEGLCVCHKCDNRVCVNPNHLFLGTNAENTYDRVIKGRSARSFGDKNGNFKLADEDVIAICNAPDSRGVTLRLARLYGVSQSLISMIRSGKKRVFNRVPEASPEESAYERAANRA